MSPISSPISWAEMSATQQLCHPSISGHGKTHKSIYRVSRNDARTVTCRAPVLLITVPWDTETQPRSKVKDQLPTAQYPEGRLLYDRLCTICHRSLMIKTRQCLTDFSVLFRSTGHVFQIHLEQLPPHSSGDLHSHDSGYAPRPHWNPARHRAGTCQGEHPYQTCKIRRDKGVCVGVLPLL